MKVLPCSIQGMYPNRFRTHQDIQTGKKIPQTGKNDTVSISDEARAMQAKVPDLYANPSCMPSIFGREAGKDGIITDEEIKKFAKENMKKAEILLMDTLKSLGILGNQFVSLQQNTGGKIEITSHLPRNAHEKLEQSINENQEFVTAFKAGSLAQAMMKIEDDSTSAQGRFGVGQIDAIHEFLISMEQGAIHMKTLWPDGSRSDEGIIFS